MKASGLAAAAAELGVKLTLIVPAILGGFIALYFFDEPVKPGVCERCKKAAVVIGGTALGLFCGPLIVEAFSLSDKNGRLEMGFAILIAALGMAIVANALKAIKGVDWSHVLESWVKRGSGG